MARMKGYLIAEVKLYYKIKLHRRHKYDDAIMANVVQNSTEKYNKQLMRKLDEVKTVIFRNLENDPKMFANRKLCCAEKHTQKRLLNTCLKF